MLQLCYSYVTAMLQLCYSYVTAMLQLCYSYVTAMLQLCYSYVTAMLQSINELKSLGAVCSYNDLVLEMYFCCIYYKQDNRQHNYVKSADSA